MTYQIKETAGGLRHLISLCCSLYGEGFPHNLAAGGLSYPKSEGHPQGLLPPDRTTQGRQKTNHRACIPEKAVGEFRVPVLGCRLPCVQLDDLSEPPFCHKLGITADTVSKNDKCLYIPDIQ